MGEAWERGYMWMTDWRNHVQTAEEAISERQKSIYKKSLVGKFYFHPSANTQWLSPFTGVLWVGALQGAGAGPSRSHPRSTTWPIRREVLEATCTPVYLSGITTAFSSVTANMITGLFSWSPGRLWYTAVVRQEYIHTVVAHSIIRVGGCLLSAHTWQAMNIYLTDQVSHLSALLIWHCVWCFPSFPPPPLKVLIVSFWQFI